MSRNSMRCIFYDFFFYELSHLNFFLEFSKAVLWVNLLYEATYDQNLQVELVKKHANTLKA